MRGATVLVLMMPMAGCGLAPVIDRAELDQRYEQTALAEGVVSSVPKRVEAADPPKVVNWWYAGTGPKWHHLVYRELTWGPDGDPVGREQRYRLRLDDLVIRATFARSRDDADWVPLYAVVEGVDPPADLPTSLRQAGPKRPDTVRPEVAQPDQRTPVPIEPPDR